MKSQSQTLKGFQRDWGIRAPCILYRISYGFLTSAGNGNLALHQGFFLPIYENLGLVFGGPKGVSPPPPHGCEGVSGMLDSRSAQRHRPLAMSWGGWAPAGTQDVQTRLTDRTLLFTLLQKMWETVVPDAPKTRFGLEKSAPALRAGNLHIIKTPLIFSAGASRRQSSYH